MVVFRDPNSYSTLHIERQNALCLFVNTNTILWQYYFSFQRICNCPAVAPILWEPRLSEILQKLDNKNVFFSLQSCLVMKTVTCPQCCMSYVLHNVSIDVSCSFLVGTKTLRIVANIAKIGQKKFCLLSCLVMRQLSNEMCHMSSTLYAPCHVSCFLSISHLTNWRGNNRALPKYLDHCPHRKYLREIWCTSGARVSYVVCFT